MADGRIGWYGVSSNTCVSPPADPEATSVTRMVEASGGRMAVLQLPYNLFETGALLEPNTPEGTALDAAVAHDLGVLVNRPLNAMAGGASGLVAVRLADPPRPGAPNSDEALQARVVALGEQRGGAGGRRAGRRAAAHRRAAPGALGRADLPAGVPAGVPLRGRTGGAARPARADRVLDRPPDPSRSHRSRRTRTI